MVEDHIVEDFNEYQQPELFVYNKYPPLKMEELSLEETEAIMDVLERNTYLEKLDRRRIQKVIKGSNRYLSQYNDTIKDRCRFCSSTEVYFINPLYSCIKCLRLTCITCLFPILWCGNRQFICAYCLCAFNTDKITGKWFNTLTVANNRERDPPIVYINDLLKKVEVKKMKKRKSNNNEWISIDQTISKWNYEERKESNLKKSKEIIAQSEMAEIPEELRRHSSLTNAVQLTNDLSQPIISLSLNYIDNESRFITHISNCTNMPFIKDMPPNIYIKMSIEPHYKKNIKKQRSKTIMENINPQIDETFSITLSKNKRKNGNLIVTIYSFNKMAKDTLIGEVIIPIDQTLTTNKGNILSYKVKPLETPISSLADKKILITRLLNSVSKSSLYYEKKSTSYIEPEMEMFERGPHILTKIKYQFVHESNYFNIHWNLLAISNTELLFEESTTIKIGGTLMNDEKNEISVTEKISIFVDPFLESQKLDGMLLFSNINGDLDLDTMNIRLDFFQLDGILVAQSLSNTANVWKKIKADQGSWFHINLKIHKF